jgi:hypothetical protein
MAAKWVDGRRLGQPCLRVWNDLSAFAARGRQRPLAGKHALLNNSGEFTDYADTPVPVAGELLFRP